VRDQRQVAAVPDIDLGRPWHLHPKVALREEPFGALAYHYESRRLVFLRSLDLVRLVRSLERFESADAALESVPAQRRPTYRAALIRLATSGVLDAR
jgi:putative mycofactocin binding protein MftB